MSIPTRVARYYADDRDVFDLLSQSAVSLKELRRFLRTRGIVLAPSLTKEQICRYFQICPLSWTQLELLLDMVESPAREDKFSTCRFDATGIDSAKVLTAAGLVQQQRASANGEVYRITADNDGAVEVTVYYSEPNFSKTRVLQSEDKELTVRLEREGGDFKVRYHENSRALQIVEALEKQLAPADKPVPKRKEIIVSGLTSIQRSKFFVEMARGIEGYELKDERGLQVDRPLDDASDESADEGSEDASDSASSAGNQNSTGKSKGDSKSAKAEFQGLVKRALLHGTGLLTTQQYQDYANAGYSLSKLIWTVEPEANEGDIVEFGAEFRDGKRGTGFRYAVFGKYERAEDGTFAKSRKATTSLEKNNLLALLEASAYSALAKIEKEAETCQTTAVTAAVPLPSPQCAQSQV